MNIPACKDIPEHFQPIGLRCNEAYCAPFISAKCLFKGILFSQIHSTRPRLSGIKVMQAISSKLSRQSLDKFIVNNEKFNSYSGTDVTKFLQGVCTNDVNKLKNHGDCIAAAFLTPKVKLGLIVGRKFRIGTPFLYTFIVCCGNLILSRVRVMMHPTLSCSLNYGPYLRFREGSLLMH